MGVATWVYHDNANLNMPKKKGKKKGKGKGKGKGKKAPPPPVLVEDDAVDEMSKRFFTIQIVDLESRLYRYQVKCDRLQLENDDLEKKLKQQLEDQEQMITFLKRKNHEQAQQFMDLEEKLLALKQAKEKEREKLEAQLTALKEDSQRALDEAAMENKMLQAQLDSLETFRQNKERLENELKQKDEMMEHLKKQHEEIVYNLEKKAVLDKDRMKKEMVAKVNSVAAEFRKVSDIQMAETTKRAIRENVSINQQLSKMSEKTMQFIQDMEELKQRERDLLRRVDILEFSNQELTKKNVSCQKVLRLMRDKVEEKEAWNSELEQKAIHLTLIEQEVRLAQEEGMSKDREIRFLKDRVNGIEEELAGVRARLSRSTKELGTLQKVTSRASATIHGSLKPVDSEEMPQRENLLASLLNLLTAEPSAENLLRYQPGDLGTVPPATSRENTHLPPIDKYPSLVQHQT